MTCLERGRVRATARLQAEKIQRDTEGPLALSRLAQAVATQAVPTEYLWAGKAVPERVGRLFPQTRYRADFTPVDSVVVLQIPRSDPDGRSQPGIGLASNMRLWQLESLLVFVPNNPYAIPFFPPAPGYSGIPIRLYPDDAPIPLVPGEKGFRCYEIYRLAIEAARKLGLT